VESLRLTDVEDELDRIDDVEHHVDVHLDVDVILSGALTNVEVIRNRLGRHQIRNGPPRCVEVMSEYSKKSKSLCLTW
jgi:hypothetical protein